MFLGEKFEQDLGNFHHAEAGKAQSLLHAQAQLIKGTKRLRFHVIVCSRKQMINSSPGGKVLAEIGDQQMTKEFNVVIEKDEDGYFVASVPALRGCHTQAKSLDVLMKRIKEAIELCLEVEDPVSNQFVGVQRIAVMA
jgi:predicted RNase H-like HicB family nuclease